MDSPSKRYRLTRLQWIPSTPEQIFHFFSDASNLARITPSWLAFEMVRCEPPEIQEGTVIEYRIGWMGARFRWVSVIRRFAPPRLFEDEQLKGPYRYWLHTHRFERDGAGTRMIDEVSYSLPFGPVGALAHRLLVRRQLEQIFDYRSQRISELFGSSETRGPQ